MEAALGFVLIACVLFALGWAVEYHQRQVIQSERDALARDLELYVAAHEGNPYPVDVEEMKAMKHPLT